MMHQSSRRQRSIQQRVLLEFCSLKRTCPEGIYLSLKPGDFSQWSGVLFVRKGPYASAILRFEITFPLSYPKAPPVIRFTSDIFHPLITPLTTYTYSSSISNVHASSASDEDLLPGGGFSLKYGFPKWFEKRGPSVTLPNTSSQNVSKSYQQQRLAEELEGRGEQTAAQTFNANYQNLCTGTGSVNGRSSRLAQTDALPALSRVVDVLEYVKSTFDDAAKLDEIPLEAAGNPGAWKAWQAHRKRALDVPSKDDSDIGSELQQDYQNCGERSVKATLTLKSKRPEEWNWDGVWQERVRHGINASISDPVMYGVVTEDDPIRFVEADDELIKKIKYNALERN